MTRSFEASDLVTIPTLNAAASITLGTSLCTVHDAEKHPPVALKKSYGVLQVSLEALRTAYAAGEEKVEVTAEEKKAADDRIDNVWRSIFELLSAWARLPVDTEASRGAEEALVEVFPDGLRFLNYQYKEEWAESDKRVTLLSDKKHKAVFDAIGATVFLETLLEAHAKYGEVLRVTVANAPAKPAGPPLAECLDNFRESLRTYVLKVAAHAEDDPETQAVSTRLLAPLSAIPRIARRPKIPAEMLATAPGAPAPAATAASPTQPPPTLPQNKS